MSAADIGVLVVAIAGLWALSKSGLIARMRRLVTGQNALAVGGFGLGLFFGPTVIGAVQGALSGAAALAATNLAGITDVDANAMLLIGVAFVAIYFGSRVISR